MQPLPFIRCTLATSQDMSAINKVREYQGKGTDYNADDGQLARPSVVGEGGHLREAWQVQPPAGILSQGQLRPREQQVVAPVGGERGSAGRHRRRTNNLVYCEAIRQNRNVDVRRRGASCFLAQSCPNPVEPLEPLR